MTQPKKVNYLNNKDILKQIHQSKMTYCYVQDDRYNAPDIIVESVKKINKTAIKQAQINKAAKLSTLAYQEAVASGDWTKKPKQKEFTVDPEAISESAHVKANDEAKAAGLDAYTIGGKIYKVQ